jgi:hypothetical protein
MKITVPKNYKPINGPEVIPILKNSTSRIYKCKMCSELSPAIKSKKDLNSWYQKHKRSCGFGLTIVFYDRKNNCEVTNKQLCLIKFVTHLVSGNKYDNEEEKGWHELQLGEFGYKSSKCPIYKNWDMFTNYTDLIFYDLKNQLSTKIAIIV